MYQKVGASAYKKDLTNSLQLDDYLNHPHKAYDTIHVAGTNGKGTTCHTIASILQEAGYNVGLYTSPHLKDFRERIKINGEMITKDEVTSFVSHHRRYLEDHKLSFFEMTVGMAFEIFKERKIDIAVIETGLGGRLDSTNIITPVLSVITSIDKDHTDLLGNTLSKIAVEKAGIIKNGVPVLINQHRPRLRRQFQEIANSRDSELTFYNNPEKIKQQKQIVDVQKHNERLGRQALEMLRKQMKYSISDNQIEQGILNTVENTGLQGRYQTIGKQPKILADVAHNPAGIHSLFTKIKEEDYENLHVVFGAVKGKSLNNVLNYLPNDASYYLCEPDSHRRLPVHELSTKFNEFDLRTTLHKTVTEALAAAKKQAGSKDLIVVTGSTFVVAEIL